MVTKANSTIEEHAYDFVWICKDGRHIKTGAMTPEHIYSSLEWIKKEQSERGTFVKDAVLSNDWVRIFAFILSNNDNKNQSVCRSIW